MPVGLPSERRDAVTAPRGPPLRCVATMGPYQGASTPASQIQPASSLPYGSACPLAGSPGLRSLSLVGAGVGEQSKHTLDTTRRVWAGNAEPPAAARTPAFYQGPRCPAVMQERARVTELFAAASWIPPPHPSVTSLLPAPSVSALCPLYPAPLTCLHGWIRVGARRLRCSGSQVWVRPIRLTVPAWVSWCPQRDRLIIDRLVCPRLCQLSLPRALALATHPQSFRLGPDSAAADPEGRIRSVEPSEPFAELPDLDVGGRGRGQSNRAGRRLVQFP